MSENLENPNLKRRGAALLLARSLAPFLKIPLRLFAVKADAKQTSLTVFQSYLVGDFFMALSALKRLAGGVDLCVLCRPDCVDLLTREGLRAIPFDNSFFVQAGPGSFLRTFAAAWKLRGSLGNVALDFDADPRSAFWLKIAGVRKVVSYSRPGAALFDALFPIDANSVHQADKNDAVASGFFKNRSSFSLNLSPPASRLSIPDSHLPSPVSSSAWIISCWTRKDEKNWPLDRWGEFLQKLSAEKVPFHILEAPDGDAAYKEFLTRWNGRAEVARGSLTEIAEQVRSSKGIIGTDNFLGHMAGYYGKPVLWINGSSDARQVAPKGPHTDVVQFEPMPCRPCGHRCVNPEYKACLNRLTVETVWRGFEKLNERVRNG